MSDQRDKVKALVKILPQMSTQLEARHLVTATLGNNKSEMISLRKRMGNALKPILGDPNGYYMLDLGKSSTRSIQWLPVKNERLVSFCFFFLKMDIYKIRV